MKSNGVMDGFLCIGFKIIIIIIEWENKILNSIRFSLCKFLFKFLYIYFIDILLMFIFVKDMLYVKKDKKL